MVRPLRPLPLFWAKIYKYIKKNIFPKWSGPYPPPRLSGRTTKKELFLRLPLLGFRKLGIVIPCRVSTDNNFMESPDRNRFNGLSTFYSYYCFVSSVFLLINHYFLINKILSKKTWIQNF